MHTYLHTYITYSHEYKRGAPSPPAVWPQGVLFYKSESTESDRHNDNNSCGLVENQLAHSSDWEVPYTPSLCFLLSLLNLHEWYPHALQLRALTAELQPTR